MREIKTVADVSSVPQEDIIDVSGVMVCPFCGEKLPYDVDRWFVKNYRGCSCGVYQAAKKHNEHAHKLAMDSMKQFYVRKRNVLRAKEAFTIMLDCKYYLFCDLVDAQDSVDAALQRAGFEVHTQEERKLGLIKYFAMRQLSDALLQATDDIFQFMRQARDTCVRQKTLEDKISRVCDVYDLPEEIFYG